ncbi:MAG: hypothetical protein ACO294_05315 [Methylococcales bacterium]
MITSFITEIVEANDGTGDGILQLPEMFTEQEDWREGDIIQLENKDNTIVMVNVTKKERDEGLPQQIPVPLD